MNKVVFLDVDGVLTDWSGGVCKLLGIDPYDPEAQKILRADKAMCGYKFGSLEDVDKAVLAAGHKFWMDLELLPWANDLLELCNRYDLYFLTASGRFHQGAAAKCDYILEHFGSYKYVITKYKYLCAKPNALLIDDLSKNVRAFEEHGGVTFHWPCQWKLREDPALVRSTLMALEAKLKQFHI